MVKGHAVTQKGSLPRTANSTLAVVDLELQVLFEIAAQGGHDALCRPATVQVDVAVVSVTTEGMASSFQFVVQIVKQDI